MRDVSWIGHFSLYTNFARIASLLPRGPAPFESRPSFLATLASLSFFLLPTFSATIRPHVVKEVPVIVELVIIGFEVLAWMLMLLISIFGYTWIHFDFVAQWATQLSFALLGLAYMFGVIFDKAISSLPFGWIVGHGAVAETADRPGPVMRRIEVLAKNPEMYRVIQNHINQHKLVRATVFNFALISLSALLLLFTRTGFNPRLFLVLLFLSAFFVGLTLFTGRQSARTLTLELEHASNLLASKTDRASNESITNPPRN